jgi:hypothetical protein
MITVTADGALQALLSALTDEAVIQDAEGNVLGFFTPRQQARAKLYEKVKASIDPAEMKRRKEAEHGKGCSFEQMMQNLKALEASE